MGSGVFYAIILIKIKMFKNCHKKSHTTCNQAGKY